MTYVILGSCFIVGVLGSIAWMVYSRKKEPDFLIITEADIVPDVVVSIAPAHDSCLNIVEVPTPLKRKRIVSLNLDEDVWLRLRKMHNPLGTSPGDYVSNLLKRELGGFSEPVAKALNTVAKALNIKPVIHPKTTDLLDVTTPPPVTTSLTASNLQDWFIAHKESFGSLFSSLGDWEELKADLAAAGIHSLNSWDLIYNQNFKVGQDNLVTWRDVIYVTVCNYWKANYPWRLKVTELETWFQTDLAVQNCTNRHFNWYCPSRLVVRLNRAGVCSLKDWIRDFKNHSSAVSTGTHWDNWTSVVLTIIDQIDHYRKKFKDLDKQITEDEISKFAHEKFNVGIWSLWLKWSDVTPEHSHHLKQVTINFQSDNIKAKDLQGLYERFFGYVQRRIDMDKTCPQLVTRHMAFAMGSLLEAHRLQNLRAPQGISECRLWADLRMPVGVAFDTVLNEEAQEVVVDLHELGIHTYGQLDELWDRHQGKLERSGQRYIDLMKDVIKYHRVDKVCKSTTLPGFPPSNTVSPRVTNEAALTNVKIPDLQKPSQTSRPASLRLEMSEEALTEWFKQHFDSRWGHPSSFCSEWNVPFAEHLEALQYHGIGLRAWDNTFRQHFDGYLGRAKCWGDVVDFVIAAYRQSTLGVLTVHQMENYVAQVARWKVNNITFGQCTPEAKLVYMAVNNICTIDQLMEAHGACYTQFPERMPNYGILIDLIVKHKRETAKK